MSELNRTISNYIHMRLSGIVKNHLFGPRFIVILTYFMTQVILVDINFIVNMTLFSNCLSCN